MSSNSVRSRRSYSVSKMKKTVLLMANAPFVPEEVFLRLSEQGIDTRSIGFEGNMVASFALDAEDYDRLTALVAYFKNTGIAQMGILFAPFDNEWTRRLLGEALAYFPNRVCYPHEVILKEIGYDNYASYGPLMDLFRPLADDGELWDAGRAYLGSGLDACKAAKSLYLHRNTFNNRLHAILASTGIDIRDYHNAMLLELYYGLKGKR